MDPDFQNAAFAHQMATNELFKPGSPALIEERWVEGPEAYFAENQAEFDPTLSMDQVVKFAVENMVPGGFMELLMGDDGVFELAARPADV
jgi:hypothetical protein